MLDYDLEERDGVWIVRFAGDIGSNDDHDLKSLFVELVDEKRVQVVADMGKVAFVDSMILGTLVWGMKNLRENGGDLRLFGLHDFVQRLFDITQLSRAFRLFEDEAAAAGSFG